MTLQSKSIFRTVFFVISFFIFSSFFLSLCLSTAFADDKNNIALPSEKEGSPSSYEKTQKRGPKIKDCLFCLDYGRLLIEDTRDAFTSFKRWEKKEWTTFSLCAAGIAGSMFLIDRAVKDIVQKNQNATTDNLSKNISRISDYSWGVLGAFYVAGIATENKKAKAVAGDGLAASIIASGIIAPVLKKSVGRSRPDDDHGPMFFNPFRDNDGFPSGHTTQAFTVASVISSHYEDPWVKAISYGSATLVGLSRIGSNSHYFSDVLTGAIIGTFVGKTVVYFNNKKKIDLTLSHLPNSNIRGIALSLRY